MSREAGQLDAAPAHSGTLIAVLGPSGVGKDTLIAYAREKLREDRDVMFVRRVVTRDAQTDAEDHDTLNATAFMTALAQGKFAVTWEAHGLRYAIPAEVLDHLAAGGAAVVNGSRAALPAIRSVFDQVQPVHVTCSPEILAARLAARGRETAEEQKQRLARAVIPVNGLEDAVEIDNSHGLTGSGDALVQTIRAAIQRSRRWHLTGNAPAAAV